MGSWEKTGREMGGKNSKASSLARSDLDWLIDHTKYNEQTILEWHKGFRLDCPDGKLTAASFRKIYRKCFPSENMEEFSDHVFRTFDKDKNGFIDFKEFLQAIDITSTGSPEEKLEWAFSMYDVDGNGSVDLTEMTRILSSLYKMMGPGGRQDIAEERALGIFHRMDVNNDGRVTRAEFVRTCLNDQKLLELLTPNTEFCKVQ